MPYIGTGDPPQTKIAVLVHEEGFAIVVNREQHPLPSKHGNFDYDALGAELKHLKASYLEKADLQVLSEDPIKFDTLVKTMDAAMASGFPDISLLDAATSAP